MIDARQIEAAEDALEAHAEQLAELLYESEPGTTRVELRVSVDDGWEATVTTVEHDDAPLPALADNEVYCFRLAEAFESDHHPHGWWRSGEGVISQGLEHWNIRVGPAEKIP